MEFKNRKKRRGHNSILVCYRGWGENTGRWEGSWDAFLAEIDRAAPNQVIVCDERDLEFQLKLLQKSRRLHD